MATQIADRGNAAMSFSNTKDEIPVVSKLEATRIALAQEQKKRIDAAVARVTSKKESVKRKGMGERTEAGHHTKKSKTVVDVANDQVEKNNSIVRRMVNRFATMPEPEHETIVEPVEPVTRSMSAHHFVAQSTTISAVALPHKTERSETLQTVTTKPKTTTVEVVEKKNIIEIEDDDTSTEDEHEEKEGEDEKQGNKWDGPTTNFHVKHLGLDDSVDIYAPTAQQEEDVQRVRERAMYMPNCHSTNSVLTYRDGEDDLDFVPKAVPISQASEQLDAASLPEVDDASKTQELAEEAGEIEEPKTIETSKVHRPWVQRVFVFTPLLIVAMVALVFALLLGVDWSQETFQLCEVDSQSAEGAERAPVCASFLETQSLIKSTLRETANKVQEAVQSFIEEVWSINSSCICIPHPRSLCYVLTMATKTVLSFEGERELVTEERAHELVRTYADAEAQQVPPLFTHITLRNKSYTLEAARVIAAFFSRLEVRGAFKQLTSVDFADMIAGRPENEALQVLATLCDALSSIKTLTRIDLSDNALGEKGVRACFGLLQDQEQLQHIFFCNNGISAAAAGVIVEEVLLFRGLDTPTKLETFHFYNNMSGDGGAIALAKLLPLSPALKNLRFSATRAQRAGSLAFATALASLKQLEKLDLSDNTFKTQGAKAIALAVKTMPNLMEINFRDAALEDDGVVAIADALREGGAAKILTALDISGNDLTAKSMSVLGRMLHVSDALRVLQVEENEIGSKGAKAIAKALKIGSPALEKVVANVNEIRASGAIALIKAVVDKEAFAKLNIDGNLISAEGVANIDSLLESLDKRNMLGSLEDNEEDEEDEDDEEEEEEAGSVERVTAMMDEKLKISSGAS
ncbi:hypothetical protein PsorP6_004423 [Peronosclerospora sorghi]|uniref:Uncharacterized protein n=1 Tax=Peronosclerospora sorghi TaxID=230839 RepID=A0ACC0VQL3_9STRA|nr:hypothetical protein PsorP6_004423 [Peronosclerospora sorghi]